MAITQNVSEVPWLSQNLQLEKPREPVLKSLRGGLSVRWSGLGVCRQYRLLICRDYIVCTPGILLMWHPPPSDIFRACGVLPLPRWGLPSLAAHPDLEFGLLVQHKVSSSACSRAMFNLLEITIVSPLSHLSAWRSLTPPAAHRDPQFPDSSRSCFLPLDNFQVYD